jgi:hypothetical protein
MKKILILCFLCLAILSACTKKDVAPKPSIAGIWKGKFGIGANVAPNQDVIFDIKDDGTILVYNGADIPSATVKGSGTYMSLNGGIELSAKYTYPGNALIYAIEMKTTSEYKDLKGTWTYNNTPGGKIELQKI